MTKSEFIETIDTFYSLMGFIEDNDLYEAIEDVHSISELDDLIEEEIKEFLRHDYWYNLPNFSEIDRNYDYYVHNGGFEVIGLSDNWDLPDYKLAVIEYIDENCENFWDEEEPVVEEWVDAEVTADELADFDLDDVVETPFDIDSFEDCLPQIRDAAEAAVIAEAERYELILSLSKDKENEEAKAAEEAEMSEVEQHEKSMNLFIDFVDTLII